MPIISDNMWSALVGAVLGAALAHAIDAARERRRNMLLTQRVLLGDVLVLHAEWKALLVEVHAARRRMTKGGNVEAPTALLAQLTRLDGRIAQANVTLAHAYSSRPIRAGFAKLRSRYQVSRDLFLGLSAPDERLRDVALEWLDEQAEHLVQMASVAARISTHTRGGIAWVGWGSIANKRWSARYEDLQFEDRAPPWCADVRLYLVGLKESSKEGQALRDMVLAKVAHLACAEHRRSVQVTLRGRKSSYSVEVAACCQPMSDRAIKLLGIAGTRNGAT
jgi:hypothetical protein